MKNSLRFIRMALLLITISIFRISASAQTNMVADSITMGPSYANEVYYSMQNGIVSTYPRDSWDIAFRTMIMSSSIITNDGRGVVLYTYPKADTSGWATVDTSGLQTWSPMFNGTNDWENGAFMTHAKGGLDFGWGIYNTNNHYITGDSLYVIQLRDGSFRKLWMQVKKAGEDIYIFKYAHLDGTGEQDVTLNCNNYLIKEFIGYSLETNTIIDYQPEKSSWDLVFTKYIAPEPPDTVYNFMGIESNANVYAWKFMPVAPNFTGYNPYAWDSTKIAIGHDWKSFTNSAWVLTDSLAYFVKSKAGDIYKFVITKYEGSSTGKIVFMKSKIAGVGIDDQSSAARPVMVYPNPATDKVHITLVPRSEETQIMITDLTGRTLFTEKLAAQTGQVTVNSSGFASGICILKISSGTHTSVNKIIISR